MIVFGSEIPEEDFCKLVAWSLRIRYRKMALAVQRKCQLEYDELFNECVLRILKSRKKASDKLKVESLIRQTVYWTLLRLEPQEQFQGLYYDDGNAIFESMASIDTPINDEEVFTRVKKLLPKKLARVVLARWNTHKAPVPFAKLAKRFRMSRQAVQQFEKQAFAILREQL